jgi:HK97 family phage major capsid protein
MKKILKPYRHLTALAAVILGAFALAMLGMPPAACFLIVMCYQLMQFAMSKGYRHGRVCITALTDEQIKEFEGILKDFEKMGETFKELNDVAKQEGGWAAIKKLPELLKTEQSRVDELHNTVKKLSKQLFENTPTGVRWVDVGNGPKIPYVTEECAKYIGAMCVVRAANSNKLKGANADDMIQRAAGFLNMEAKAAIAATDIPLPVQYASQIVELVYAYGQARKLLTVYPLGASSVKLPRLKSGEPAFGFIAVSGNVGEKVPQMEFITFTPGKAGGIVRIPSEIDADSIVAVGQFVARYIAREMAKLEDNCVFIGDGTSTYNSINGVGTQATADSAVLQLAATNSSSDKITLANCRTLRTKVTGAVLKTSRYYAHPTMEALFVTYNTSATVTPYIRNADGTATLDGFPIEWVNTMPVYSTSATLNAYQIYFGDLSWWYFGERMTMSVETSRDVYFATDEIGIRALERIDIHLMGQSSTAALQLSAS